MYVKISGQSSKSNYRNTGSCASAVMYDVHEQNERPELYRELGLEPDDLAHFDMNGNVVSGAEVIEKIDRLHAALRKEDAKFYVLMINPSDEEAAAMGGTIQEQLQNGREYVFAVMDAYAKNFGRDGISDRRNLAAWAIPHIYKKDGKEQLHWHVVVARKDVSNKFKLSPLTNHKNTGRGAVRGGFDRQLFDGECERLFDERFGYERRVEESFDYCLAMKRGDEKDRAEQGQRRAMQDFAQMQDAFDKWMNDYLVRVTTEASIKAAAERKKAEEDAKKVAAAIEKAKRNRYWNSYNSHYKPIIDDVKKVCNDSFELYVKYKTLNKECSSAITAQYDKLRRHYNRISELESRIQTAPLARNLLFAVATVLTFANPLLGIAVGLVSGIIAAANKSTAVSEKKKLRADAAAIRDNIVALKEKQRCLQEDRSDALQAWREAKEDRQQLYDELNALREELDKPAEDYLAARREAEEAKLQHNNELAMRAPADFDIYDLIMTANNKYELEKALLRHISSIKPIFDDNKGVADFLLQLPNEGRTVKVSVFSTKEHLHEMLDKWEDWTGDKPAWKIAEERRREDEAAKEAAQFAEKERQRLSGELHIVSENGKKVLAANGQRLSPPCDDIRLPQNGDTVTPAVIDGHPAFVNVKDGTVVRDNDGNVIAIKSMRQEVEGFCVYTLENGKQNYMDMRRGKVHLTKNLDEVEDMHDGVARVVFEGDAYVLARDGDEWNVSKVEEEKTLKFTIKL